MSTLYNWTSRTPSIHGKILPFPTIISLPLGIYFVLPTEKYLWFIEELYFFAERQLGQLETLVAILIVQSILTCQAIYLTDHPVNNCLIHSNSKNSNGSISESKFVYRSKIPNKDIGAHVSLKSDKMRFRDHFQFFTEYTDVKFSIRYPASQVVDNRKWITSN